MPPVVALALYPGCWKRVVGASPAAFVQCPRDSQEATAVGRVSTAREKPRWLFKHSNQSDYNKRERRPFRYFDGTRDPLSRTRIKKTTSSLVEGCTTELG